MEVYVFGSASLVVGIAGILVGSAGLTARGKSVLQFQTAPSSALQLVSRLVWAWWLVATALAVALVTDAGWVRWIACVSLAGSGLMQLTRFSKTYAQALILRAAQRARPKVTRRA